MTVSGQIHVPGKESGAHLIDECVSPRDGLDHLEKRKSVDVLGFEPRIVQAYSSVTTCTELSWLTKLINFIIYF
jgi:hypothetical protein